MDINKFDEVLDINDPKFADKFREAIGLKDGEKLEIMLPQFERTDGKKITYIPKTVEEFDALKSFSDTALKNLGLGVWEHGHWLYPQEWYDHIPNGYEVTVIDGRTEKFQHGVTDNDIRFGLLAYGFMHEF